MDQTNPSPSYTFKATCNYSDTLSDEHSSTSSDPPVPVIVNDQTLNSDKPKKRSRSVRTTLVHYGPIAIRKRQTNTPTLATGRLPKHVLPPNEDVKKRELRRMKNRESARRLKRERDDIELELRKRINQLESEEVDLTSQIDSLRMYKEQLQHQNEDISPIYQIITQTAADILSKIKHEQQQQQNAVVKSEETPPSPSPPSPSPPSPSLPWQLAFQI